MHDSACKSLLTVICYTSKNMEETAMPKETTVTIEHIEVRKSDIEKVKKIFQVKDNAEAIKQALDMAAGKIELESIFVKYRSIKIQKIYA